MEKFAEKFSGSLLEALECPDEVRKLDGRVLVQFEPVDQELAFLKSGYNSQSKQWFVSYGLPKLGYPKFIK